MRRAAQVDGNQQVIIDVLRGDGHVVASCAAMGHGFPDLLVLSRRTLLLHMLEVKNLDGFGNKLTPDQVKFHAQWPVVQVVTSPEEALAAVRRRPRFRR